MIVQHDIGRLEAPAAFQGDQFWIARSGADKIHLVHPRMSPRSFFEEFLARARCPSFSRIDAVCLALAPRGLPSGTDDDRAQVQRAVFDRARGRRSAPDSRRRAPPDGTFGRDGRAGRERDSSGRHACMPGPLSARVSIASAPCPTAGHMTSRGRNSAMRSAQPSRLSPAAASTMASNWPSSSLRSRVSTLPANGFDDEIRPQRTDLGDRAASEPVPTRPPGGRSSSLRADHGVARVFALGSGGDLQAIRQFGRHVFQAVDCEIDAAFEQRFFDLFREQALGCRPLSSGPL